MLLSRVVNSVISHLIRARPYLLKWLTSIWSSGKEVAFTLIVSNATLLVAVFIHLVDNAGARADLETAAMVIFADIRPTEILAYVLAIIAAPLWVMVSRWQARRHANLFFWLLALQILMVSGSAYIFARARSVGVANTEFATRWALYCFVGSVLVWFVTLTYEKLVLDAGDETMATPSSSGESGDDILTSLRGGR